MMSEASITKVPQEIWRSIFSFCSKEQLWECMFVCSSWYLSAKRALYEEVVISDGDTGSRFTVALVASNNGIFVRRLTLSQNQKPRGRVASPLYSPVCIQSIFQNCPNLLSVNLDNCNPYYMLRSLVQANLDKLQQIKISWSLTKRFGSPAVKRNFLLANQLNQMSIISLDMPDIPDSVWMRDDALSKKNYLFQFLRLEHLTINQSTHVFISFSKILSSLPRLKSLHYISFLSSLGTTNQDVLDSSKIKYTSLNLLSLDVFNVSTNDVEYIINSFPNLKTLSGSPVYPKKFKDYIGKLDALLTLVDSP